ncbi:MAG: thiol reductase thioredoxin [Actinobacteria bacterium]|nr:thiol reductase thioredoxin [Actinomycetota bacterium]
MRQVSDATFEREVLSAQGPVVVDFWAPWCHPCRAVTSILEEIDSGGSAGARFVALNVDENPVSAARNHVLSLPTVIVFDGGEARGRLEGAQRRKTLERVLADWVGPERRIS